MDNLESILKDKETFKQFLSSNSENRYNLKRGSLKRHAEDTLKKEKLVCSICDSSFKWKDSLNRHLKNIHAEDSLQRARVVCSICSMKFMSTGTCNRHIKIKHGNEKYERKMEAMACPICSKAFSWSHISFSLRRETSIIIVIGVIHKL